MSLDHHLTALFDWLGSLHELPKHSGVRVIELRGERKLLGADEYAARFAHLLEAGYGWINLSCYGLLDERLVVAVELPRDPAGVPPGKTSVNYSGPPLDAAGQPAWDRAASLLR
jgi:hypothetical protein